MKAIACAKSGPPDGLEFKEVDKPVPKDNEILIGIGAASVNHGDLLAQAAEAHCYVEQGLKKGSGVITVAHHDKSGCLGGKV